MPAVLGKFEDRMHKEPEIFGRVTVRHINPPRETTIAPPGTVDLVLTFRNVHNWIMANQEHEYFASFFKALKPGGVLGWWSTELSPVQVWRACGPPPT